MFFGSHNFKLIMTLIWFSFCHFEGSKFVFFVMIISRLSSIFDFQEAESLNKIEQTNKISELLRKNKELEKEIHALKDRVTKLTNENKVLKTTTAMGQKSAPIEEKEQKINLLLFQQGYTSPWPLNLRRNLP